MGVEGRYAAAMDPAFTDEQEALRDRVRTLLADECTPHDVRASWTTKTGRSAKRWQALAELGVLGVAVPEELGGMGRDETWLVLLWEEAGRAALPEPLGEVSAATSLIVDAAPEPLRQEWLPRIISGEVIAVTALAPGRPVEDAHVADLLLVAEGRQLHVLGPDKVELEPAPTMDRNRRLFTLIPRLTARSCLAHRADAALAMAVDRRDLAEAAYLLGTARMLADLSGSAAPEEIELAAPAVYGASRSVAMDGTDRTEHVAMAHTLAARAARAAARTASQMHGASGSTEEHDLDPWLQRALATSG